MRLAFGCWLSGMLGCSCLGLLLYASFLWATNPIPAHITALSIPLLAVLLRVCCIPKDPDSSTLLPWDVINGNDYKPGDALEAKAAASVLSSSMFDPVILLFLGGFAIAAALDRYHISSRIASFVLSSAGTRPSRVLLALLVMGVFFSAFMSNVAAAVLVSSIITPMAQSLPGHTEWPQMALLGVAFSCNIGGMVLFYPLLPLSLISLNSALQVTTIASPQNIIAVLAIHDAGVSPLVTRTHIPHRVIYPGWQGTISFMEWTGFALPSCIAITAICWVVLRLMFKTNLPQGIEFNSDSAQQKLPPVTKKDIVVGVVVFGTILLWCLFDSLKDTFGNIGISQN